MAKVTEVQVGYGKTINMGNYESLRIDVWARAVLTDGDDPAQVSHDLRKTLKGRCHQMVQMELNDRDTF